MGVSLKRKFSNCLSMAGERKEKTCIHKGVPAGYMYVCTYAPTYVHKKAHTQ